MTIRTRAELDEALRRVFVDAIADEEPDRGSESRVPLVTIAPSDRRVADLRYLTPARTRAAQPTTGEAIR